MIGFLYYIICSFAVAIGMLIYKKEITGDDLVFIICGPVTLIFSIAFCLILAIGYVVEFFSFMENKTIISLKE